MTAALLTLALFVSWALIGRAAVALAPPRLTTMQSLLVSPAVGVAVTVLPVFWVNRAGVPVGAFAPILLPSLTAVALLVLVLRRPVFPLRRVLPFAVLLAAAFVLVAWPMLEFGFDWISYENDDMANYTLSAQRLLNHGFFDAPDLDALFAGRDYSTMYWYMQAAAGVRAGSDLMLAAVWAVTGLNGHQVFMPVIVALHLALVAATAAMVAGPGAGRHRVPLIAAGLVAVSPLATLGTMYELIGQTGGLALLCAAITLMYRPVVARRRTALLRMLVIPVVVLCGVLVWYPEVLPFLGLGWIVWAALRARRQPRPLTTLLAPAALAGILSLVVLNGYAVDALRFLLIQASAGVSTGTAGTALFPYFLVPSGLPLLWGLTQLGVVLQEPLQSISIAVALGITVWFAWRVTPGLWRRDSAPLAILAVMTAIGLMLFHRGNDFGLFKLTMFLQPFLAAALAGHLAGCRRSARRGAAIAASLVVAAVVATVAVAQAGHVRASARAIPDPEPALAAARAAGNGRLLSDVSSLFLIKYLALHARGDDMRFPGRDIVGIYGRHYASSDSDPVRGARLAAFQEQAVAERTITANGVTNSFEAPREPAGDAASRVLVTAGTGETIFNLGTGSGRRQWSVVPAPRNHLLFIHSTLGQHYYLADHSRASFFRIEPDPMMPGARMAALGNELLFRVVGPSDGPRMLVELSDTVLRQFDHALPSPLVQDVPLPFTGRGSGRVISAPLQPTDIDGHAYVALSMRREGRRFDYTGRGLAALYGRDVPIDGRRVTAFAREISLIAAPEYDAMTPPAAISRFPDDLKNRSLEYSGIYEDGWISERAFFVLAPAAGTDRLAIEGSVPNRGDAGFATELTVTLDGRPVAKQRLTPGDFALRIPVAPAPGRHRVDLVFSAHQSLAGADVRPVGAKISHLGFGHSQP